MATATYWQRGESLDYTNTTSSPLAAGSIVKLQSCIGIVEETIAPNATGAIAVEGVSKLRKQVQRQSQSVMPFILTVQVLQIRQQVIFLLVMLPKA